MALLVPVLFVTMPPAKQADRGGQIVAGVEGFGEFAAVTCVSIISHCCVYVSNSKIETVGDAHRSRMKNVSCIDSRTGVDDSVGVAVTCVWLEHHTVALMSQIARVKPSATHDPGQRFPWKCICHRYSESA